MSAPSSPPSAPHRKAFDKRPVALRPYSFNDASFSPTTPTQNRPYPSSSSIPAPSTIARHPGCVLCSLVASASFSLVQPETTPSEYPEPSSELPGMFRTALTAEQYPQPRPSDLSPPEGGKAMVLGREILYHDKDITIYPARGKERLCTGGRHLMVVVNRHLESVYDLGPADVPLLSHILDTSRSLFSSFTSASPSRDQPDAERGEAALANLRVGFVGNVTKDPQSPHRHFHAHAMLGPPDTSLPGATLWRRHVVFGGMNWWSIEDLRAEIRESTSNNRIKSGYAKRISAPIERVPDAGSRSGLPNALDPDPYRDDVPPPIPDGITAPYPPESSAIGRYSSSSSSSKTLRSLVVPMQNAATRSEESLPGARDGYVAVELLGSSSSSIGARETDS